MAALTVFSIPELLETILLEVDVTTLLVSTQRVSHTWNATIRGSHHLQTRLFFKPSTVRPAEEPHVPGQSTELPRDKWLCSLGQCPAEQPPTIPTKTTMNPFLLRIWDDHFSRRTAPRVRLMAEHQARHVQSHHAHEPQESTTGQQLERQTRTEQKPPVDENIYRRPEASWRRMLLRQPPSPHIQVLCHDEEETIEIPIFHGKAGFIRFRHLDDAIEDAVFSPSPLPGLLCAPQRFHSKWGLLLRPHGDALLEDEMLTKYETEDIWDRSDVVISMREMRPARRSLNWPSLFLLEIIQWLTFELGAGDEAVRRLALWGRNVEG